MACVCEFTKRMLFSSFYLIKKFHTSIDRSAKQNILHDISGEVLIYIIYMNAARNEQSEGEGLVNAAVTNRAATKLLADTARPDNLLNVPIPIMAV